MSTNVHVLPSNQLSSYSPAGGQSNITFVLPSTTMVPGSARFVAKATFADEMGALDAWAGGYGFIDRIQVRSSTLGVLDNIKIDSLAGVMNGMQTNSVPDSRTFYEGLPFGSMKVSSGYGTEDESIYLALDLSRFVGLFSTSMPIAVGTGTRLGQIEVVVYLNSDRDALTGDTDPATGTYSFSEVSFQFKRVPPGGPEERLAMDFTKAMKTLEVYTYQPFTLSSGRSLASWTLSRPSRGFIATVSPQSITAGRPLIEQLRPSELSSITLTVSGVERPDYEVVYETSGEIAEAVFQDIYEEASKAVSVFSEARTLRSAASAQPTAAPAGPGQAWRNPKVKTIVGAGNRHNSERLFAIGHVFDDDVESEMPVLGLPGERIQLVINSSIDSTSKKTLNVHLSEVLVL